MLAFLTLLGSFASVQGKPGKTGEKKFPCKSNSKYKLRSTPGQFTVAIVFGCRIMRIWPDGVSYLPFQANIFRNCDLLRAMMLL